MSSAKIWRPRTGSLPDAKIFQRAFPNEVGECVMRLRERYDPDGVLQRVTAAPRSGILPTTYERSATRSSSMARRSRTTPIFLPDPKGNGIKPETIQFETNPATLTLDRPSDVVLERSLDPGNHAHCLHVIAKSR